jgi:radical SAM superfamily enzyme YgiQ (UPF0313 family)
VTSRAKSVMSTTQALSVSDRVNTSPNVLMIFPRFNPNSYWSMQAVCDIEGRRCLAPPLGLITLAALLPAAWNIRLINRNAEELSDRDLDWADLVMTGGMLPQRSESLALIEQCQARGKPVVIGGPDAMSSPDVFAAADFRVLGEAEGLIDQFIAAWSSGARSGTFEGEKFQADVTKSPVPRFDLLTLSHYLYIGIQFSRGCPFTCEFCDIIELYGRVPRAKTNEQMLAELDALYRSGYRGHVDFVDDNLIGNKKALKRLLPDIIAWQKARRYPFKFSTEASLNLADDVQLLLMMREANFFAIFVGIESPDTETLIAAQKKQNTRRSLAASVHKIYEAGMFVIAGFIVGFDTERGRVAENMTECIAATGIPACMVGLLTALPNTQLTRRLEQERRLLPLELNAGDQCTAGLNFVTLRPRREVLQDYKDVLSEIYRAETFFQRARLLGRTLDLPRHPSGFSWRGSWRELRSFSRIAARMARRGMNDSRHFWAAVIDCGRYDIRNLEQVLTMAAFYLHLAEFTRFVVKDVDRQIAELPQEEKILPLPLSA